MSSSAEILWEYLVDTVAVFTDPDDGLAWPLYVNSLPDGNGADNTAATINDTPGIIDGKSMRATLDQHYGVQIICRDASDTLAYAKIVAAQAALMSVYNIDVTIESGVIYTINNVSPAGPVIRLGPDEQRRMLYSVNFLVSVVEV